MLVAKEPCVCLLVCVCVIVICMQIVCVCVCVNCARGNKNTCPLMWCWWSVWNVRARYSLTQRSNSSESALLCWDPQPDKTRHPCVCACVRVCACVCTRVFYPSLCVHPCSKPYNKKKTLENLYRTQKPHQSSFQAISESKAFSETWLYAILWSVFPDT